MAVFPTSVFKNVANFDISSTGSYTASAGVTTQSVLYIECFGGGQSGAGGVSAQQSGDGAAGGSAGGYSAVFVRAGTVLSTPYTCSVGAGGASPAVGVSVQNAGGDTLVTSGSTVICLAPGGGSATPAVGDLKVAGAAGGVGLDSPAIGGFGGAGLLGGGGTPAMAPANTPVNGGAGAWYGSGGAGGASQGDVGNATGSRGGAGANGFIRIWEYI